MVRLAFAIAFLGVFGMVAVWVVSYLERNFWKKDFNKKEENKDETKQENKTN